MLMRSVFQLNTPAPVGNWTVNKVLTEAYALATPGTNTEDTVRRTRASTALRAANPGLPVGDNTDIPAARKFLWLRRIPRTPFRIPATPTPTYTVDLRAQLAAERIHSIHSISRMTTAFIDTKLVGVTATAIDIARLKSVCALLRVSGMSIQMANALFAAGISSAALLRDATQAAVRAAVEPVVPTEMLAMRPAFHLQRNARLHSPKGTRPRVPRFIGALSEGVLRREITFWRDELSNPRRSKRERASAEVVASLLELQVELAQANARSARGNLHAAYGHLRTLFQRLGVEAVKYNHVVAASTEANGPSLQTILLTCNSMLNVLETSDVALCRRRFGARETRPGEGLSSFVFTDLNAVSQGNASAVLNAADLWSMRRSVRSRALALLSERTVGELATATFAGGLSTAVTGGRVSTLRDTDLAALTETVFGKSIGAYRGAFTAEWTELSKELSLFDVKDFLPPAMSTDGAPLHIASTAYPTLLGVMKATERFFGWRPSRRPTDAPLFVPLNANFSQEYRTRILVFLRDSYDHTPWRFDLPDFADPARFAFLLPAMVAGPLRRALARTFNPQNRYPVATALNSSAAGEMAVIDTVVPTVALDAMVSDGENRKRKKQTPVQYDEAFLQELELEAKSGDESYVKGRIQAARDHYQAVLDLAAGNPQSATLAGSIGNLFNTMETDALALTSQGKSPVVSMSKYTVEVGGAVTPALTCLFPPPMVQRDATEREALRVPGAVVLAFYGDLSQDEPTAGGGIVIRDFDFGMPSSSDLLDDFELGDDNDDDEIIGLPIPPPRYEPGFPPVSGGGEGGGSGSEDVVVVDADLVEAVILYAGTQLRKISAGLNWLGFDNQVVPAWRFDHLLSQARYFAEKADALQQRSLAMLQAAEGAQLAEADAVNDLVIAFSSTEVAKAGVAVAEAQVDVAQASLAAADMAARHSQTLKWVALAAGIAAAAAATVVTAGAAGVAIAGLTITAASAVSGGAAAASATAGFVANQQARNEAQAQQQIAQAQNRVAHKQVVVARAEQDHAAIVAAAAAGYLALMQGQQLTSAAYFDLNSIVGNLARSYLQLANRLAWLAERAYEVETRRRSSFVRMDYGFADSLEGLYQSGATLLRDLDIVAHDRITARNERFEVIKTTFSLLGHQPGALGLLQSAGETFVRITQRDIDLRFPGLFLHSLKRMEIEFVGLLPLQGVSATVRICNNSLARVPNDRPYVYRAENVVDDWLYPSTVYKRGDKDDTDTRLFAPFVLKPLLGSGYQQMMSEYRRDRDSVAVAPPEGSVDTFENLGTDLSFTIELPKTGNPFPFGNLADARVTLYFTAHQSDLLADRQRALSAPGTRFSMSRTFVASAEASESFTVFRAPSATPARTDVRFLTFDVAAASLHPHVAQRVFQNFQISLLGLFGASLSARVVGPPMLGTWAQPTSRASVLVPPTVPSHVPDGMLFSADGEITQMFGTYNYVTRAGSYPQYDAAANLSNTNQSNPLQHDNVLGTWVLKVAPGDNPAFHRKNDDGVVVLTPAKELSLVPGSSATSAVALGSWLHGETRVLVKLAFPGILRVKHRSGAVTAQVTVAGPNLTVEILEGAAIRSTIHISTTISLYQQPLELVLRVYGSVAEVQLDRVRVATFTALAAGAAGTVTLEAPTGTQVVHQVTHRRLRFDGAPLELAIDEVFDTLGNWTTTGSPTLTSVSRPTLDLSAVQDVLFQLDYTADWKV